MADTLRVNTDLLDKSANALKAAGQGFGEAASILAGLDTSQEWWTKMGRINPISLQDEGSSVDLGDAGAAVRALTSVLRRYDSRTMTLGNNVSRAANLFKDLENQLINRANSQNAGAEGNVIGMAGAAAGVVGGATNEPGKGVSENLEEIKKPTNLRDFFWTVLKDFSSKIGTPWAVISAFYDMYRKKRSGGLDGYSRAKGISSIAKPIVKWADWMIKHTKATKGEKILKSLFGVEGGKTYTGWKDAFTQTLSKGPNLIDIVFSAVNTGVDNYKEYKSGAISGDRAVVEWRTEFALDTLKTWGIGAGGAALGTAALVAVGVTPVGWAAAAATVVGTAVVAGGYAAVNWAFKEFLNGGKRGIIEEVGHRVGELYDNAKDAAKDAWKWMSKKVKVGWGLLV